MPYKVHFQMGKIVQIHISASQQLLSPIIPMFSTTLSESPQRITENPETLYTMH